MGPSRRKARDGWAKTGGWGGFERKPAPNGVQPQSLALKKGALASCPPSIPFAGGDARAPLAAKGRVGVRCKSHRVGVTRARFSGGTPETTPGTGILPGRRWLLHARFGVFFAMVSGPPHAEIPCLLHAFAQYAASPWALTRKRRKRPANYANPREWEGLPTQEFGPHFSGSTFSIFLNLFAFIDFIRGQNPDPGLMLVQQTGKKLTKGFA